MKTTIGTREFTHAVEAIAIAYRLVRDGEGRRMLVRANLADLAIRTKEMLEEQARRDGLELEIEGFDRIIAPETVPINHPAAVFNISDPPSAIQGR